MPDGVSFDFGGLMRQMESQAVKGVLGALTTSSTPAQLKQMYAAMDVFERHGIRATEALQIIVELSEVFKNDAQGAGGEP